MEGIYCKGENVVYYDGYYWRLLEQKGKWITKKYYTQFAYKTNPNPLEEKLLHRYIYKKYKGNLPKDKTYVVHHINEDELNNTIQNLSLITRSEHNKLTRKNLKQIRPEAYKMPPRPKEAIRKTSEAMKGKKHTQEHIKKTLEAKYNNALKRIEEEYKKQNTNR